MNIERSRFLVLTMAISACHTSLETERPAADGKPAATTVIVASAKSPDSPDASILNDPCAVLAAANDAVLARPSGTCTPTQSEEDFPNVHDVAAREPDVRAELISQGSKTPFFHACHRGKGTWAVSLESAKLATPTGESGLSCGWSVTYKWLFQADANAPLTKGLAASSAAYEQFADESTKEDEGTVFDFDGDGRDELIVHDSEWENGGGDGGTTVAVLTSSGQSINAYPVDALAVATDSIDADGDGRPDFLYNHTFTAEHCGLVPTGAEGPRLLLHALPDGTFSETDEVARRWAATECPRPVAGTSSSDDDCAVNASCLRIWGQSTALVMRTMKASPACTAECQAAEMTTEVSAWKPPFATLEKHTPQPFPPLNTK